VSLVVITDCDHGSTAIEEGILAEAGIDVRVEACATADEVAAACGDADALIVQYAVVDDAALERLPRCLGIVRYGVGVDTIDVPAAARRGVAVANVPDYGVDEVAEHALALILALVRGVGTLDRSVKAGDWDFRVAAEPRRLSALTLGVVGHGRIGAALAGRAAALGFSVLAYDPAGVLGPAEAVELDELLRRSDVVSVHTTLELGAPPLIDARALALMQREAWLVNTARGGVVDSAALLAALDEGRLAGAGLDVLGSEPPQDADAALARHERVICTPHVSWWSRESFGVLKAEAAREAVRIVRGEPPRSPVGP
jgi:D-3-phosphoglycerate dehydrogenase